MKTKNTPKQTNVAILCAEFNSTVDDGWHQLLPAGKFKAVDGRPNDTDDGYWFLDEQGAQQFIENTIAYSKGHRIVIDYDHQTLHKNATGNKALASGWIIDPTSDIKWIDGKGIYIRPEWTPVTQKEIDNKQWGYLSAVYPYDKAGRPLYLSMAAITNDPGLRDIESLAVLAAEIFTNNQLTTQETKPMNELLKTLLIALGVISADDITELTDEQLSEVGKKAVENIEALKTAATAAVEVKKAVDDNSSGGDITTDATQIIEAMGEEITDAEKEVLTQVALSRKVDMTKFFASFMPASLFGAAVKNQAVLSSENTEILAKQLVEDGRKQGRVLACEVKYLTGVGKAQGVAALSKIIDSRSPLTAILGRQTGNITKPEKVAGVAVLSAEQKEAARLLGKSEADYLTIIQKGSK